jgi:photosystem II stability/assembly factor-like uncharacterized protein
MPAARNRFLLGVAVFVLGAAAGRPDTVAPNMLLLDGAILGRRIVAVGERGTVLHSPDLGKTWHSAAVPDRATLTGISFAPNGKDGWAVGHDALILVTADGGRTWRKQWQGVNLTDSFLDVLVLDERHVIAVGAFGLFMTTVDGGATWQPRRLLDEDYHFNRLTRGPTGTLYLAGEHGTLLRSPDQGASWTPIQSPYDGSFYGILPLSAHQLLAYGLRGRLYFSDDDGEAWTLVANEQRGLLLTAVHLAENRIIVAGQARAFLALGEPTMTLTALSLDFQTAVAELLALPDGSLLALGEAGATRLPHPLQP